VWFSPWSGINTSSSSSRKTVCYKNILKDGELTLSFVRLYAVSMVDGDLFDKLARIGSILRKKVDPFGGIQVGPYPSSLFPPYAEVTFSLF
jgi:hypothetical protein